MVHPASQNPRLQPVSLGDCPLVSLVHAAEHARQTAERHHLGRDPDGQVGEFFVRAFEVSHEQLARPVGFVTQTVQPILVVEPVEELARVDMTERPVPLAKGMGHGGSKVDLDDLQRLGDQVSQGEVEIVRLDDLKVVPAMNWCRWDSKARQ
jgi:hypothetical protein